MTTDHTSAPGGVAGHAPDAGGVSNEPAAPVPVSTTLPRCGLFSAGSDLWKTPEVLVPATVGATVVLGLVVRNLLPEWRFTIALALLGLVLSAVVVFYVLNGIGRGDDR